MMEGVTGQLIDGEEVVIGAKEKKKVNTSLVGKNGLLNGVSNKKYTKIGFQVIADPKTLKSVPLILQNSCASYKREDLADPEIFSKIRSKQKSNFKGKVVKLAANRKKESKEVLEETSTKIKTKNKLQPVQAKLAEINQEKQRTSPHVQNADNNEKEDSEMTQETETPRPVAIVTENSHQKKKPSQKNMKIYLAKTNNNFINYVVHLKYPCIFKFTGRMRVTVLVGEVESLGCSLSNWQDVEIYSPKYYTSLDLEVKPVNSPKEATKLNLRNGLVPYLETSNIDKILTELKEQDAVALLGKINHKFVHMVNAHFDKDLFSVKDTCKGTLLKLSEDLNCQFFFDTKEIQINPSWHDIPMDNCTVLCGGKGVGKSTLMRYLINRTLQNNKSVLCLDFDPGQSEFTPSGFVSAVIVNEPIIGPNFTHLRTPARAYYLGEMNVAQCPLRYLECVYEIIQFYRENPELANMKCIVNTMGFCKGVGVPLMLSVLKMLNPTTVVQIRSSEDKKNYPLELSPNKVNAMNGFQNQPPKTIVSHNFYLIESSTDVRGVSSAGGLTAKERRDVSTLSYCSQMLAGPYLTMNSAHPYCLPFSKFYLATLTAVSPGDILKAFNGSIVALCTFDQDSTPYSSLVQPSIPEYFKVIFQPGPMPCHALGLVRSVDVEKKEIHLIVKNADLLRLTNCLLLGCIGPPSAMYLEQDLDDTLTPYIEPSEHTEDDEANELSNSMNKASHTKIIRRTFRPQ